MLLLLPTHDSNNKNISPVSTKSKTCCEKANIVDLIKASVYYWYLFNQLWKAKGKDNSDRICIHNR